MKSAMSKALTQMTRKIIIDFVAFVNAIYHYVLIKTVLSSKLELKLKNPIERIDIDMNKISFFFFSSLSYALKVQFVFAE